MPKSICLHNLFESQAELHPNAPAVKFLKTEVSYQELNEGSNQLAYHLRSEGVKTGDKVSILLERSINLITGILGILKSGGTYVPINPKSPIERIDFQLKDLGNPILLTNEKLFSKVSKYQKAVKIDEDLTLISEHSCNNPNIEINEKNISVILYTSGSTGTPKGVPLSHKALVNRLIWDRDTYNHTANDVVLQHSSFTFDFSVLEIFMALANGGKLVLARPEFHYDSLYLIELIQKEKITKMGSVPSLLQTYINLPAFEKCTSLEYVFLGGEPLPLNLQNTFFSKSSAELINIYGPTEASISVLNWTCERNSKHEIIPIGFPVAGLRIYILDENNQPVPDGEVGEIYIAGVGLADGYYNRPELTASNFLHDPFIKDKNERMYKSGDWGKKLPNGAYQFLGRKDFQVKVRGLRIELQEIEHHLNQHFSIETSVVTCIENQNKEMKLAAYLIPSVGSKLDLDEIKNHLSSKLPDYMVPNMFVQLSAFPLSDHGKIDRSALPHPDKANMLSNTIYTAPINETQKQLVKIWEDVLQVSPIGITESFYNIGGDSLAAIEMHIQMEAEMGCTLPLSVFANADTIEEQSEVILSEKKMLDPSIFLQFRIEGEKTPIIFVNPAHGVWIDKSLILMKYLDSGHPFLATQPFGENSNTIPDSIEGIADFYCKYLEAQYPSSEYIIGGYSMGGLVAYDMATILKRRGINVKYVFLVDTYHPEVNGLKMLDGPQMNLSARLTKLAKSDLRTKKEMILRLINRRLEKIIKEVSRIRKHYKGNVLLIAAREDELNDNNIRKWEEVVLGELNVREIPGTHASIVKDPEIKTVAHIINDHVLCE